VSLANTPMSVVVLELEPCTAPPIPATRQQHPPQESMWVTHKRARVTAPQHPHNRAAPQTTEQHSSLESTSGKAQLSSQEGAYHRAKHPPKGKGRPHKGQRPLTHRHGEKLGDNFPPPLTSLSSPLFPSLPLPSPLFPSLPLPSLSSPLFPSLRVLTANPWCSREECSSRFFAQGASWFWLVTKAEKVGGGSACSGRGTGNQRGKGGLKGGGGAGSQLSGGLG